MSERIAKREQSADIRGCRQIRKVIKKDRILFFVRLFSSILSANTQKCPTQVSYLILLHFGLSSPFFEVVSYGSVINIC